MCCNHLLRFYVACESDVLLLEQHITYTCCWCYEIREKVHLDYTVHATATTTAVCHKFYYDNSRSLTRGTIILACLLHMLLLL